MTITIRDKFNYIIQKIVNVERIETKGDAVTVHTPNVSYTFNKKIDKIHVKF